jgi:hypothetical protein
LGGLRISIFAKDLMKMVIIFLGTTNGQGMMTAEKKELSGINRTNESGTGQGKELR